MQGISYFSDWFVHMYFLLHLINKSCLDVKYFCHSSCTSAFFSWCLPHCIHVLWESDTKVRLAIHEEKQVWRKTWHRIRRGWETCQTTRQVYFGEVKWEEGWVVKDLRLWRNSKDVLAKTMESPQGTRVLLGDQCLQECITLVFAVLSHWLEKPGGSAASSWTGWQISDDRSGVVGQLRFLPSAIWDMFSWQPYLVARECFFSP